MADDALATARRIRQPVRSTSEALEAFDSVTYAKGRAVLAMTEAWLGPDAFRAGLRGYLQRHAWGNATADDLYAALARGERRARRGGRDGQLHGSDRRPDRRRDASTARTGQAPAVSLHQQEYRTLDRPAGSAALWRIPVCVVALGRDGGGGSVALRSSARS